MRTALNTKLLYCQVCQHRALNLLVYRM